LKRSVGGQGVRQYTLFTKMTYNSSIIIKKQEEEEQYNKEMKNRN
jgi:hypothetical protein